MPPSTYTVKASASRLAALRPQPTTRLSRHLHARRPHLPAAVAQCRNLTCIARPARPILPQRPAVASSQQPSSRPRLYHSYDHPEPTGSFSLAEQEILSAAYTHVPEHGFSQKALALGAKDAGYLDISTNVVPEGVFSLIRWHLVTQRKALAGKAQELFGDEEAAARIGVGKKVELLTWERLLGNSVVVRRWQEALAVMAQPSYVPASVKELAMLADEIWFLAGDKSVDPSWYTKRASLSAIYASTELFMTTDTSEGFTETLRFLRRRLDEAQEIGGTVKSIGSWVGFTASAGLNVLRSKGLRI